MHADMAGVNIQCLQCSLLATASLYRGGMIGGGGRLAAYAAMAYLAGGGAGWRHRAA